MSSKNTLKEIAVSAISTAKDIYGTIYIIVEYKVGIFPFNDNKCDVTDMLLPHGAACESGFSTWATHLMIVLQNMAWFCMESYAKIDSN